MKLQKLIYTSLCTVTLASTLVPTVSTFAATSTDETTQSVSQTSTYSADSVAKSPGDTANVLSESDQARLSNYVSIDPLIKRYVISSVAKNELSFEEFSILQENIIKANELINESSLQNPNSISIENNAIVITDISTRAKGVTKAEVHWNYVRIWLSKGTIQGIGAGVTLAGIWIPEPVVSKIAATLGVAIGLIPSGIRFDYNFYIAGLDMATGMRFSAISNIHWQ